MTLKSAEEGREYIIKSISTDDTELNKFLFSLGCYEGETITVIRHLRGGESTKKKYQKMFNPLS